MIRIFRGVLVKLDRVAGVLSRVHAFVDPDSIPPIGVSHIVVELPKLLIDRTQLIIEGRATGVSQQVVPEPIRVTPSSPIVPQNIIWVSDPEGSWSKVGVQQGPGLYYLQNQVVIQDVPLLPAIFEEEGMSHHIVGNVIEDSQLLHIIDGDRPVVGVEDGVASNVGLCYSSDPMELNGVPPKHVRLSHIEKLNILNPPYH